MTEIEVGQRVRIPLAYDPEGWSATVVEKVNRDAVRVRLEGELPSGALREFSIPVKQLMEREY